MRWLRDTISSAMVVSRCRAPSFACIPAWLAGPGPAVKSRRSCMVAATVRRYARVVRIVDGRLFAFVAFDVGFEIDLEKARTLLHGTRVPAMRQDRPTPPEVEYPEVPVELNLGEQRLPGDI